MIAKIYSKCFGFKEFLQVVISQKWFALEVRYIRKGVQSMARYIGFVTREKLVYSHSCQRKTAASTRPVSYMYKRKNDRSVITFYLSIGVVQSLSSRNSQSHMTC